MKHADKVTSHDEVIEHGVRYILDGNTQSNSFFHQLYERFQRSRKINLIFRPAYNATGKLIPNYVGVYVQDDQAALLKILAEPFQTAISAAVRKGIPSVVFFQ